MQLWLLTTNHIRAHAEKVLFFKAVCIKEKKKSSSLTKVKLLQLRCSGEFSSRFPFGTLA